MPCGIQALMGPLGHIVALGDLWELEGRMRVGQEAEQKLPKGKWGGEGRLWERLLMGKNLVG